MKILIFTFLRLVYATKIVDISLNSSIEMNPVVLPVDSILKSNEITLCLQFKIEETKDELFLLHDNSTNFELDMKFSSDYGFFRWDNQRYIFSIPEEDFHPFAWYHFCFSMDQFHYNVIVNGIVWFSDNLDKNPATDVSLKSIHLAEEPKGNVQKGVSVSRLNIWSQSVSDEILGEWSSKCDDDLNGDIFSWNYIQNSIKDFAKNEVPSRVSHFSSKTSVRTQDDGR